MIKKFNHLGYNDEIMTKTTLQKLEFFQSIVWYFIFLQAIVAMFGSLYYSTFGDPVANILAGIPFPQNAGFTPCLMCWFARILMYPISFISLTGAVLNDKKFTFYILPLAIPGIALEIYHYLLQKTTIVTSLGCTSNNPCNAMEVNYLGFITIPFLCLTAFVIITILCFYYNFLQRKIEHMKNNSSNV